MAASGVIFVKEEGHHRGPIKDTPGKNVGRTHVGRHYSQESVTSRILVEFSIQGLSRMGSEL